MASADRGLALWGATLAAFVACWGMGCQGEGRGSYACEDLASEIALLEPKLFGAALPGEGNMMPDEAIRDTLLLKYAAFANACHDDERTPEMLFRRADLLRSTGAVHEAMTLLRDLHDHHPNYPGRARAAFLVGFLAEVELNDREQARMTYRQVLEVHPGTEEAEWAQQALNQLDLTPDQILTKFGSHAHPDSASSPR
jgi:tetratricopeptide (TPR) repeat protein